MIRCFVIQFGVQSDTCKLHRDLKILLNSLSSMKRSLQRTSLLTTGRLQWSLDLILFIDGLRADGLIVCVVARMYMLNRPLSERFGSRARVLVGLHMCLRRRGERLVPARCMVFVRGLLLAREVLVLLALQSLSDAGVSIRQLAAGGAMENSHPGHYRALCCKYEVQARQERRGLYGHIPRIKSDWSSNGLKPNR